MGVPDILVLIGAVLFVVELVRSDFKVLGWWGGLALCAALLWHLIPT